MNTCLLIPILTGLICALLGYLLGKLGSNGGTISGDSNLQADLDACRANTSKLNATITSLQAEINALKAKTTTNTQSFAATTPTPAVTTSATAVASTSFDGALATKVFGKKIKQDDLKIVEGIGPKIEGLYHNAGIKTWKALSETPVEKSKAILDEAGDRFAIHNPSTWAKQALFAHQGKWQELKDWQNTLSGGKE
jgi:predicted flap endonuclease-1-like 5' DNA nuclease